MAKGKSSKKNSKTFFTIVVASTSALALILLTTILVQKPTNTESNASAIVSGPSSTIEAELRYDNGDGEFDRSDNCPAADKYTLKLSYNNPPRDGLNTSSIKNSGCVTAIKPLSSSGEYKYDINLLGSDKLAYMYVVYSYGGKTEPQKISDPKHSWPIDAGPNKKVKVIYGLKKDSNNNPGGGNTDGGGDNSNQTNKNCKPSIDYHGSTGASKSVTYRFSVENNCKNEQAYRVWVAVDRNDTTGWVWKFAKGDENSSVKKTISGKDKGEAIVEVSRANVKGLPKGNSKYRVSLNAAPCKEDNNCKDLSDIDYSKVGSYSVTYYVEN